MIWLIGCKGLLGSELAQQLNNNKLNWIGTDTEVDITNPEALDAFAKGIETAAYFPSELPRSERQIKWIINCAGLADFQKAEDNPDEAERINYNGCENIARLARKIGAKLIHISCFSVFSDNSNTKFAEDDKKEPSTVLGKTHLQGEIAIQKEMNQYYILRSGLLYGKKDSLISQFILSASKQNVIKPLPFVNFAPTNSEELADVIIQIINKSNNATELFGKHSAPSFGVYNFSNSGEANIDSLSKEIQKICKKLLKINNEFNVYSEEFKIFKNNCLLNCDKICKELNIKIPSWDKSLEKFVKNNKDLFI